VFFCEIFYYLFLFYHFIHIDLFLNLFLRAGHELYNVWVALVDTTNEFSGVQGYLN